MTSSERAPGEGDVPTLALTPGEPAGIGPDVVIAAAQTAWPARVVAIADPELLKARAAKLGLPLELLPFDPEAPARRQRAGTLQLEPVHCPEAVRPGKLDAANSAYVVDTLARATQGCLSGRYDALVTGPVQKSIINEAGVPFSGHTEFLAEQCGVAQVVMLLAAEKLRVALATTHLPLAAVPSAITGEHLEQVLAVLDLDLRQRFGIERPRVTVLGLNPHAGENGHLGREEIEVIIPTLNRMRDAGLCLNGPLPADTAFNPDIQGRTDAYLAMYHDQGLPVLKYAGFGQAVNITLGLPFVRTSVDHGTALSLAGRGDADEGSMLAAIRAALQLTRAG